MSKKIWFVLTAVVILAVFTSACEYSMSAGPKTDATPSMVSDFTTPLSNETLDPMKALEEQATQTAMAAAGITATQPSDGTPDPNATTETPQVDVPTLTPTPENGGPTATPEPNSVPATYTLKKGEFPYCIARRYNVNPNELMSLNGLSDAEARALSVGLVLKMPQTGNPFPGERSLNPHGSGTTYTVKSSDETIYSIACYYGDVSPNRLIKLNNLVEPYTLTVGQTLQIP